MLIYTHSALWLVRTDVSERNSLFIKAETLCPEDEGGVLVCVCRTARCHKPAVYSKHTYSVVNVSVARLL